MPLTVIPLSQLAKRLARKESELERLRRQYENRLTKLKQRREKLVEELHRVESQIQAVSEVNSEPLAAEPVPLAPKKGKRGALPRLLVKLIHEAGTPLTVKQLSEEIRRRKFSTKSKHIPRLVQARVYEMAKKGILTRAKDQPGYLVKSNGQLLSENGTVTRASSSRKKKPGKRAGWRNGQPSLREVLTRILEQSKEPLAGGELADKVVATGYKSKSKSFRDVVWVSLGQMKNVEHVAGQGYRLRKR